MPTLDCEHADQIDPTAAPDADGCSDCLAKGDTWVHLRMCLTCGHVGCCDNSKNRHARAHWYHTEHSVITSREPGEDWIFCFADNAVAE